MKRMKRLKRWAALWLALWLSCAATAAQAKTLRDYRIPGAQGYVRLVWLDGGDYMLLTSGMEAETKLSWRAGDGSVRYEMTVPLMGTQRGTMGAALPDGRYAAAYRVDETTDEVRLYDASGETGAFRLPSGADYLRLMQTGVALLFRDARTVKLIDYAGAETLSLSLPGKRTPLWVEVFQGQGVIYVIACTRALDTEAAMRAPYLLCAYDTAGELLFDRLLWEEELGFYLHGVKCIDAQDALVISGPEIADYKRTHVLRVNASGDTAYHRVLSDGQGAVVSVNRILADGADVALYGTVMAQSRGMFACMKLRLDGAGALTDSDIREFDLTSDYLYSLGVASDGAAYAIKTEMEDVGIAVKWISAVPFADLPATDSVNLAIE